MLKALVGVKTTELDDERPQLVLRTFFSRSTSLLLWPAKGNLD